MHRAGAGLHVAYGINVAIYQKHMDTFFFITLEWKLGIILSFAF